MRKNKILAIHIILAICLIMLTAAGCSSGQVAEEPEKPVEQPEKPVEQPKPESEEETEPEAEPEPEPPAIPAPVQQPGENPAAGPKTELPVIADGDYLLALVTKETTLKSDYIPSGLRAVPAHMKPSYSMQLRAETLDQLEMLWQAAAYDGIELHIRSAYRSYSTQQGLYNDYVSRYGEEEASRFSARPGQSEHQLGTTVDFGGTSVDFKAAFADTAQGSWLAENAWYFGFAMSYPAGKENITGYIFEPWHYRYIGVDAAAEWKKSGLTLGEFLESKPQFYD